MPRALMVPTPLSECTAEGLSVPAILSLPPSALGRPAGLLVLVSKVMQLWKFILSTSVVCDAAINQATPGKRPRRPRTEIGRREASVSLPSGLSHAGFGKASFQTSHSPPSPNSVT